MGVGLAHKRLSHERLLVSFIAILIESPFYSTTSIVATVRLRQIEFGICNPLFEP